MKLKGKALLIVPVIFAFLIPPLPGLFSFEGSSESATGRAEENVYLNEGKSRWDGESSLRESADPYESLYWERYGYPESRESSAVGYLEEEGKVFIYGGGYRTRYSGVFYGDTWEVNLATGDFDALLLDPAPEPRYRPYTALDPWNKRMYVYGGMGEYQTRYSDLWVFDMKNRSWNRLISSSSSVDIRYDGAMVYYRDGNCLYLLAGRDYLGENVSSFYRLDLSSLTFIPLSVPRDFLPRYGLSMTIDQRSGIIYVMGGRNSVYGRLSKFWIYDIAGATWHNVTLPSFLSYQEGGAIFYRSDLSAVYFWGGRRSSYSYNENLVVYYTINHTWAEVNSTGSAPSGRAYFGYCYSETMERFIIFGGYRSYRRNTLHYLDLDTHNWTSYDTKLVPSTTSGQALFKIKGTPYLYLMNVFYSSNMNRVYFYRCNIDTMVWEVVYNRSDNPGPHYRYYSGWAYDEDTGKIYMYGGYYSYGYRPTRYQDYADLWEYDVNTNTWTRIFENSAPGTRYSMMLFLDKESGSLYVYGGKYHRSIYGNTSYRSTMWKLDLNIRVWREVNYAGGPTDLAGMAYTYVPEKRGVYVFGGVNSSGYLDYFWFFHVPTETWTRIYGVAHPSIKEGAGMVYDPLTEEIYLYGGSTGYGGSNEFHVFRSKEMRWRNLFITPDAGERNYPAMLFDSEERYIYMTAGRGPSGIWRMHIPPRVSPLTPKIYDPEGSATDVVYAKYGVYTVVLPLRLINGLSDTKGAVFRILTSHGEVRLYYNLSSSSGEKLYDPYEQVELINSSHTYIPWTEGGLLNITFRLVFNWSFTDESLRNVIFDALPGDISGDSVLFPELLRVSGDLTIKGNPLIEAEWQGTLTNNSWVRASENITFTNISIVYSDNPELSPMDGSCFLSIHDDEGNYYNVTHRRGEVFRVRLRAKNTTDSLVLYTFKVGGIPPERDMSDILFYLRVDGTLPTPPGALLIHADGIEDPQTSSDNDTELFVAWNPALDPHSGVAGYFYSTVDGSGTTSGAFTEEREITVEAPGEGIYVIYVWAVDRVGNIGMASSDDIFVDMTPPTFLNPRPDPSTIYPFTDNVQVGITITDPFGAGIDQFSVYYRYSTTGLNGFSDWNNVPMEASELTMNVTVRLNLAEGEGNYVQWKASDMAGNVNISEPYRIIVNTTMKYPRVTLLAPENNTLLSAEDYITLEWSVDYYEPESVTYDLYLGKDLSAVTSAVPYAADIDKTNYTIAHLSPGTYYWKVVPKAKGWTGWCTPSYMTFRIAYTTAKGLELEGLPNSMNIPRGRSKAISITLTNTGEANEEITVTINSELPDVTISESSFMLLAGESKTLQLAIHVPKEQRIGLYRIELIFEGSQGSYARGNFTVVVEEYQEVTPGPQEGKKDYTFYIILLIVAIVGGALAYGLVKKSGGGEEEEEEISPEKLEERLYSPEISAEEALTPEEEGVEAPPEAVEKVLEVAEETPKEEEEISLEDAWNILGVRGGGGPEGGSEESGEEEKTEEGGNGSPAPPPPPPE